jgi:hypothetical protein
MKGREGISVERTRREREILTVIIVYVLPSLRRSTTNKVSYHFIHANPTLIFESTLCLGLFVKTVFHHVLYVVSQHSCSSFTSMTVSSDISLANLISILAPFAHTIRTQCSHCLVWKGIISAADIAHLLVLDKRDLPTISIDLHVYSRNQQMRLYECVKYDSDHPLTLSSQHPFDIRKTYTHGEMTRKSMITNVSALRVPIVKQTKDNTLVICSLPARSNRDSEERPITVPFEHPGSEHLRLYSSKRSASSCVRTDHVSTNAGDDWSPYLNVINGLINSDPSHVGSIQSIVKGNKNSNKLFFNISGNYRYCPRKGCHHLHNSVAFIVDVANDTYAIRCKDPSCDNSKLSWTTFFR